MATSTRAPLRATRQGDREQVSGLPAPAPVSLPTLREHPPLRDYEARLRAAGQFVTVQRRAILRYLLRHLDHPTTAQIAKAVGRTGSASLATVYNNLALFQELSIVQMVREPGGDLRWDLRADPHHHLTCQQCGQVTDVDASAAEVRVHDERLRDRVARTEVWLVGRCERCA